MKWKYNTVALLITGLSLVLFIHRCDDAVKYTIPDNWQFTVLNKNQPKGEDKLPLQTRHTLVAVYYPEICGYCLNQIDMIMKRISSIEKSQQKENISLICIIETKDTVIMQYYLDEKMENVNTIYIDNRRHFKDLFSAKNDETEFPKYFVIKENTIVVSERLNNKNSLKNLLSFFTIPDEH